MSSTTEAESYIRLALSAGVFGPTPSDLSQLRATTENFALDSYQNLIFSIARFNEYTGHYPDKITVVGYAMKSARFNDLHRNAIRWPAEAFTYVGVEPDEASATAEDGEVHVSNVYRAKDYFILSVLQRLNGYLPYSSDLYGCHSLLESKRLMRNPFSRYHPYHISSPELTGLFEWCPGSSEGGSTATYPSSLPWDP